MFLNKGLLCHLPLFNLEVFSSVRVEVASCARRVPGASRQRHCARHGPGGPTARGGLLDPGICRRRPSANYQARRLRVRRNFLFLCGRENMPFVSGASLHLSECFGCLGLIDADLGTSCFRRERCTLQYFLMNARQTSLPLLIGTK